MSSGPEVVVAGGGVAAAATAIRLRGLGLGVRLLVRPGTPIAGIEALPERALGLLDILGEPQLVTDAGGLAVGGNGQAPMVHVERGLSPGRSSTAPETAGRSWPRCAGCRRPRRWRRQLTR